MRSDRYKRAGVVGLISFAGALIAFVPVWLLAKLYHSVPDMASLPWDPASHALDGLKLYNNLTTFSPFSFWMNLNYMTHWPPLPPFLMIPFYALWGRTDFAPVALSLFSLFMLGFVGFLAVTRSFFPDSPMAAAASFLLYFSCLVSSPLILVFSVLVMYEIPGAMVSLMAVVAYWNALDARFHELPARAERFYRLTALSLLAILLLKWNYGLQFLLLIIVTEILVSPRTYLAWLGSTLGRPLLDPKALYGLNIVAVLSFLLIAFIAITGGGTYRLGKLSLSMTRLENPLYLFVLCVFAKCATVFWRERRSLTRLSTYHRALLWFAIVPYAIWLLYPVPNRFHALLYHLAYKNPGHPPRWSWANFVFYYHQFVNEYAFGAPVFWALFALLLVFGFFARRSGSWGSRMALAYVVFGWFSATFLTDNKEARFLCNIVPAFFLVASVALGRLTARFSPAAVLAFFPLLIIGGQRDRLQRLYFDPMTIRPAAYGSEQVVQTLRREVIQKLDGDRRITTAGISDLSYMAPLTELELHRAFPKFSKWPTPRVTDYGYQRNVVQHVEQALQKGELKWLIVFDRLGKPREALVQSALDLAVHRGHAERVNEFKFPDVGYEGALYRLP